MVRTTERGGATAVDLAGLRAQLETLLVGGAHEQVLSAVFTLLEKLIADNRELSVKYAAALRHLYRPKSEKISAQQLALFLAQLAPDEAAKGTVDLPAEPALASCDAIEPSLPVEPKRRGGRKPLPDHLRREVVPVPVPEAERTCACGREKSRIRFESQITLEWKPAELYLIEHQREIIACRACQEGVAIAPPAPKPVEGGRPGPGLLAHLVTSKLNDGLPLYRQSKIFARSGVELSDSTLGDWFAASADLVEPLWRRLRELVLGCYLISLDDTGMPTLDRSHPKGIKRGHVWTFLGDEDRFAFCEYTPDWKGKWVRDLLDHSLARVIQSDGYAGLNDLFAKPDALRGPDPPVSRLRGGCMDHVRRKFVEALDAGDVRAAVVISLIGGLYEVEAKARQVGASLDELRFRRNAYSRPIFDKLTAVVADLYNRSTPKSPLGKALVYFVNQFDTLKLFLDDPRVPLSNAHVERQQRRTALGRKNYLFTGSDGAGRRLAILQTLIVNCDLAGAPPFEYLRDVFAKLADGWPQSRIDELLPAAWLAHHRGQQQQPQPATASTAASPTAAVLR